ncbi:hypothetical protein C0J52_19453 [Blattella germanica]|nr:hypothetical protein C0J52_19453 [Blattella germanica]
MEAGRAQRTREEVRTAIRYEWARGSRANEIHRRLVKVYGPDVMSKQMVRRWCRQFRDGRTSVADDIRPGRPATATGDEAIIRRVEELMQANARMSVEKVAKEIGIGHTSAHKIIRDILPYRKEGLTAPLKEGATPVVSIEPVVEIRETHPSPERGETHGEGKTSEDIPVISVPFTTTRKSDKDVKKTQEIATKEADVEPEASNSLSRRKKPLPVKRKLLESVVSRKKTSVLAENRNSVVETEKKSIEDKTKTDS